MDGQTQSAEFPFPWRPPHRSGGCSWHCILFALYHLFSVIKINGFTPTIQGTQTLYLYSKAQHRLVWVFWFFFLFWAVFVCLFILFIFWLLPKTALIYSDDILQRFFYLWWLIYVITCISTELFLLMYIYQHQTSPAVSSPHQHCWSLLPLTSGGFSFTLNNSIFLRKPHLHTSSPVPGPAGSCYPPGGWVTDHNFATTSFLC